MRSAQRGRQHDLTSEVHQPRRSHAQPRFDRRPRGRAATGVRLLAHDLGRDATREHVAGEPDIATTPQLEATLREAQLQVGLVARACFMSATSAQSREPLSLSNSYRCESPELRLAHARRSGDPRERAALIEELMPLAKSLAWRFRTTRVPLDDLVQVACLGLVKAVDRFDPERGLRFSSFAVPTIQGELRRYLRDRTWRLHVPRALQELIVALGPVTDAMSGELQRSPTVAELAKRLRVSPEAILDARQAGYSQFGHSLDEPAHEDGRESLVETLGEEDRELAGADRGIMLKAWLAELPEREREILRSRYEEDLTQREIAARCGISQMQVSRLLRRSLERLRAMDTEQESSPHDRRVQSQPTRRSS